jgi:arsenate reductase
MKEPFDLYGLKNCDTCRKAMKALDAAGIAYVFHDIRDGSLNATQVSKWLSVVGEDALVNKRSTTWRNLTDTERQQADSEKQLANLLLVHPTLIKRPVIVSADSITVGWTPGVRAGFGL